MKGQTFKIHSDTGKFNEKVAYFESLLCDAKLMLYRKEVGQSNLKSLGEVKFANFEGMCSKETWDEFVKKYMKKYPEDMIC